MQFVAGSYVVRAAVLLAGVAVLLAMGIFGVGHGGLAETNIDTRYLFIAGKLWLHGDSAYASNAPLWLDAQLGDALQQYNFAYPPQAAPLCLLLAVGSLQSAFVIMDALNLAAVAALAYFSVRLTEQVTPSAFDPGKSTAHRWFVSAFIVGNLSTAFVVWMGQTSVIVAAALAGAWYFSRRDQWLVAGILLAVATIKPPLSMFVVLWFLLERQWRILLVMSGAILLFSSVPMLISGPVRVFLDWLGAIVHYGSHPHNALGSRMVFNLRSLFHAFGVETPDLFVVGVAATFAVWYWRKTFIQDDLLGILVGIALLFGSSHSYDLAALVLLIPAFWRHLHTRPQASMAAIGLLLLISFPNSVLVRFNSELLLHARVVFVFGTLTWLLALSAHAARDGTVVEPRREALVAS